MPEADQTRLVGAGRVAAVIGHELGHVATLQDKSTRADTAAAMFSGGDDDLVEGIAEYCSYTGWPTSAPTGSPQRSPTWATGATNR
jgi:hypothetical protein